ncbi:MAG: [FeFe] hydrogenase H-cluster radical SAM maturase HydE [Firmicutes bacterium]|nr:[FeFe] hydrogenase H-cluster radical SAM maturase HydE [[Eubacterium] siraeum]MCM1487954.1 [FeFe] hydrogenase H-cluster radical SAM maturase HydE [Bacillota bacterium]
MQNELIEKLFQNGDLTDTELKELIDNRTPEDPVLIAEKARQRCEEEYGNQVFMRGLIEFSSYCKNDCYYCGLRRSNKNAQRYRLTTEEIMSCCENGYKLGFRTFVLQGGEDGFYTDDIFCGIIREIKASFPDTAVTLSLGERSEESYRRLFEAGADRYLLRHETADKRHYEKLHPKELSLEHRMDCLKNLRRIGYQTGCGFMVGSPYQDTDCLVKDLRFIKTFRPQMVGIGPFIPHKDTPFGEEKAGALELTLYLLSIIRLLLPKVLLPATTALGTISPTGREQGIKAGANVVMPNLSPVGVRKKYSLYDNKICTGEEAAECVSCLKRRIESTGRELVVSRGDSKITD